MTARDGPERRELYNLAAPIYDLIYAPVDYDEQIDFYEGFVPARGAVLDLCCGTGRHLSILAARGWSVVGLDLSREMLRAAPAGLSLVRGDLRALPFRGPFDLVLCSCNSMLEARPRAALRATLAQVRDLLAPGGLLIFDAVDCRMGRSGVPIDEPYEDAAGRFSYGVRWTWMPGDPVLHVRVSYARRDDSLPPSFEDDHHLVAITIPDLRALLERVGFGVALFEDDTSPPPRSWDGASLRAIFVCGKAV